MAKYGSDVVVVTLSGSPGGAAKTITPYVSTISGLAVENLTQQSNPFGVASEAHTPTGMTKVPDIVLSGFYDDTADVGSWTVLHQTSADRAVGSVGRVLTVLACTGALFTITVHLVKSETLGKNGSLTEYATTLRQKSAGVWSVP